MGSENGSVDRDHVMLGLVVHRRAFGLYSACGGNVYYLWAHTVRGHVREALWLERDVGFKK